MGIHSCCSKQIVKRGLWSPEEDEKLIKYMNTYEHTSWTVVPKLAGLQRCGKSCRLRWINYLRPDLKRGAFTTYEAKIVVEVHKILGNKWAQIARFLPGRTDNEVKNFWNSIIKKKLFDHHPSYRQRKVSSHRQNVSIAPPKRRNMNLMMVNNPINLNRHEVIVQNPQRNKQLMMLPTVNPAVINPNRPLILSHMIMPNSQHINPSMTFSVSSTAMPSPPQVPFQGFLTFDNVTRVPKPSSIKVPSPSSFITDHRRTNEPSDSPNTALNEIIVEQRQIGGAPREVEPDFTVALEDYKHGGSNELADHLAMTQAMLMQDTDEDTMFFDELMPEIQRRVREFELLLNPAIHEREVIAVGGPSADEISREIINDASEERGVSIYANHVNNIESLMGSFANADVNSGGTVGLQPTHQAFDPMPIDGGDDEDLWSNGFGSFWGLNQP